MKEQFPNSFLSFDVDEVLYLKLLLSERVSILQEDLTTKNLPNDEVEMIQSELSESNNMNCKIDQFLESLDIIFTKK